MNEKYALKWNDFQPNIAKAFSLMKNDSNFTDVTLVSEDKHKVTAHKVILSACSEYFNDVLSQHKHSHPLLCLDGVSKEDLNNIVEYIYNGELQIYQENLDRFLGIGKKFQLTGLQFKDDLEAEPIGAKTLKEEIKDLDSDLENSKIISELDDKESIEELDQKILKNYRVNEGIHSCILCGKQDKFKSRIKEHIETHLKLAFQCKDCRKIVATRHSLRVHKKRRCINNYYGHGPMMNFTL